MTATDLSSLDARLSNAADEIAPDGSEVRLLSALARGSMGHFTIPRGQTIRAVRHKTVDEIWFLLQGRGEMWRAQDAQEGIVDLEAGVSVVIPAGTCFQVRNTGDEDICVIGQTMPAWPGNDEAEFVEGKWVATLTGQV